ncbi:MAG: transposase [Gammaproteobacteria bacterium]
MARPLRIEYPGAWYHVMNRGAGRGCVFPNNALHYGFLALLGDVHERYAIDCHAYCLMGNHYHLLLHTPSGRLGRAMRHVDGVYTQRHNRQLETDGPLFRGRYKAQLIEKGDYLWTVSRYIHRNPVEAKLCTSPSDYRWSSYQYYVSKRDTPSWLKRDETTRKFGSTNGYRAFVENYESRTWEEKNLLSDTQNRRYPPILGSDEFKKRQLLAQTHEYEIPESRPQFESLELHSLVDMLCTECGWKRAALVEGATKKQRHNRAMIMAAIRRHTPSKLKDIAAAFDLHHSTGASAIRRINRMKETNAEIANVMQKLCALLNKMGYGKT